MLPQAFAATGRVGWAKVITQTPDILVGGLQAAVLEYRSELLRFLAARRATPDEAEDLLQDLFVRVRTMDSGPIAEPRAYLYKIAANLLFDRRRSAARRSQREQIWTEVQLGDEMEIDERPSVEHEIAVRQELAIVAAAIAALPERSADILRRYRIDGAEQKAIAAALGISLSAVEKHLQRGYHAVAEARSQLDAGLPEARRSTSEGDDVQPSES
jgi:RNA polymerase sigma-70 factor (ECF subfamily)